MPLSACGQLSIVASSDLGGLGAKEGPPDIYNWVLPGIAPLLLPWLAILGLLALKPNRRAAAWAIWLPLGCLLVLSQATSIMPSDTDFLMDLVPPLAAGLAAVWLLSTWLRRQHRFLTFLCVLPVFAGFSGLAFLSQQIVSQSSGRLVVNETFVIAIALAVGVLVTSVAVSLCGLICRGRYRPFGLYVWLPLLLVVSWLVIVAPIYWCMEGGEMDWGEFLGPVLAAAAVNFAVLLPFLILSSASPFFRQRLKCLLHVKPEAPPVIAPLPEAALKTSIP